MAGDALKMKITRGVHIKTTLFLLHKVIYTDIYNQGPKCIFLFNATCTFTAQKRINLALIIHI